MSGEETVDVAAIRARADRALEGPWDHNGNEIVLHLPDVGDGPSVTSIGKFWFWDGPGDPIGVRCNANAEFIAHARTDVPALLDALDVRTRERDEARDTLARVEALHVPWYEINGVRREHRVIVSAWEDDDSDLPADHECSTTPGESCLDEEHYVLACVECRGVTDEGEVGYTFWPCPTAKLVSDAQGTPG